MEALYETKILEQRKKIWQIVVWSVLLFASLVASVVYSVIFF